MSNLSQEGQSAYQEYRQDMGVPQDKMNAWKEGSSGFENAAYDQLSVEYKTFLERKDMKLVHEDPFNHKQYMFGVKINPDGGARAWRKESTGATGAGTGGSKAFYMDAGVMGVPLMEADNLLRQNENSREYRWKLMNTLPIQRGVGNTDILCIILKQKRIEFG